VLDLAVLGKIDGSNLFLFISSDTQIELVSSRIQSINQMLYRPSRLQITGGPKMARAA